MNRKIVTIIALQTLLIVILFWVLVFYGKDEYEAYTHSQTDNIDSPNLVSTEQGVTSVKLSTAAQLQSDIQTTVIRAAKLHSILNAYGSVVSIDTLIDQRTKYLSAKADANIARASLNNSQQEYKRLQSLNQDDHNVSDRAVAAAFAIYQSDQTKVQAAETQADNLRDSMRQQWGETLADLAVQQSASSTLLQLLQYKEVLLQISLPFETATPKTQDSISVMPAGIASTERIKPIQAYYISASPSTDSTVQGKTYFYRAPADNLRAGMRVAIQINDEHLKQSANQDNAEGVIVPASAVVWYGGKAWVYKQQGTDKFIRLPVTTDVESPFIANPDAGKTSQPGWFNSGYLKANDRLVTNGAQLLLSEELKYQIKNENED